MGAMTYSAILTQSRKNRNARHGLAIRRDRAAKRGPHCVARSSTKSLIGHRLVPRPQRNFRRREHSHERFAVANRDDRFVLAGELVRWLRKRHAVLPAIA